MRKQCGDGERSHAQDKNRSNDLVEVSLAMQAQSQDGRKVYFSLVATAMAIYRLLKNSTFVPAESAAMIEAYELALVQLGIPDRADPKTENVAAAILYLLRDGERDPAQLARLACRAVTQE